jgi:hypothetical protein
MMNVPGVLILEREKTMSDLDELVDTIRDHHRQRRFAMKIQQKLDRALESYVRIHFTEWTPDMKADERETLNKQVKSLIKNARDGKGPETLIKIVASTDLARAPADELRDDNEKAMAKLAEKLPVYPWVVSVRGAGALGLATIVAETGNLSNYPNPAKVWKRLGFAPYDGLAGSSWKRETWRPRKLTAEEWTGNPFSGERYALIHQIAVWLKNAQWIGKAKTEDGVGKANGVYGELYAKRRAHTLTSHPDWTLMHGHMDGLRIMMKQFLVDLWMEWRKTRAASMQEAAE